MYLVGEQGRPSRGQTTARKKRTKEDKKFVINYYLKARKEGQRGYRKRMRQCWIEEVGFENEEQRLACQLRGILKTKKLSVIEIEALK